MILVYVEDAGRARRTQALAFARMLDEAGARVRGRRMRPTFSASRRSTSPSTRRSPPMLRRPLRTRSLELMGRTRAVRSRRGRHRARQRGDGARRRDSSTCRSRRIASSAKAGDPMQRHTRRGGAEASSRRRWLHGAPEAPDRAAARRRRGRTLRRGPRGGALRAPALGRRHGRPRRRPRRGIRWRRLALRRQGGRLGGRGAGSPEGFGIIEELAGLLGGAVGCSRAVTMCGLAAAHGSGRADRDEDRAGHLHRMRHLRRDPAHGRMQGREGDPRRQHGSRSADPCERRLRRDRRPARGRPAISAELRKAGGS